MSDKPNSPATPDVKDLPLKDQQAEDVQGGLKCVKGEHIKEATIKV